jgi:hypothetical protein
MSINEPKVSEILPMLVIKDGVAHCPKCDGTEFEEIAERHYGMFSNEGGKLVFNEHGDNETEEIFCTNCSELVHAPKELEVDYKPDAG